jgi:hypothetical protein
MSEELQPIHTVLFMRFQVERKTPRLILVVTLEIWLSKSSLREMRGSAQTRTHGESNRQRLQIFATNGGAHSISRNFFSGSRKSCCAERAASTHLGGVIVRASFCGAGQR